jgi:hypothetical protein
MSKKIIFILLCLIFFTNKLYTQIIIKGSVSSKEGKSLSNVNILISNLENKKILSYGISNSNGLFMIELNQNYIDSVTIKYSLWGYKSKTLKKSKIELNDFQINTLEIGEESLPEIKVKNNPISKKGDTINYSVKSFVKNQDQVIADIIKRLPGIEITESGVIKYQGKQINKYYIEGMNLLDDKYALANNNIPANSVDQIQILENHQPIKALDSFTISNQAGINIKLNNNAKNKIIGRGKIGIGGLPFMYENELVPMQFGSNHQTIVSYKNNNTGLNNEKELDLLNSNNVSNFIKGNILKNPILSIPSPNIPLTSNQRFLFNNLHTLSINNLRKINAESELKFNLDFIKNLKYQNSGTNIINFFPSDTIRINENQLTTKNEFLIRGSLNYISNTKKRYYFNRLNFQANIDKDEASIILKDKTDQTFFSKHFSVSNEGMFLKTNSNNLKGVSYFISYSQMPQRLEIKPGKYNNFFNNNIPFNSLNQKVALKTLFSNFTVTNAKKISVFSIENNFGISFTTQSYQTELLKEELNTLTIIHDSLNNNLTGKEINIYNYFKINFNEKKLKISLSIPANYLVQHNNSQKGQSINRLFFNYDMTMQHIMNSNFSMTLRFNSNDMYLPVYLSTERYILTDYRTLQNRNSIISNLKQRKITLSANYKEVRKMLFINSSIAIENNVDNILFNQNFSGSLVIRNAFYNLNPNKSIAFSTNISKYIHSINGSFALGLVLQKKSSIQMISNKQDEFNVKTVGINSKILTNIKSHSIEYTSQYQILYSGLKNNLMNKTQIFNQTAVIHLNFITNMPVKLIFEHAHLNQQSQANRNFLFGDIAIRKKAVMRKMDLELSLQNIFNVKEFETVSYSANTITNNFFMLRPTQILMKAQFTF